MLHSKLVGELRKWLGNDGIDFFKGIKAKHGRIDAIWMEGPIPHVVHFNEGMQVRNFLRRHVNWNSIQLDDQWAELVEEAIQDENT